MRILATILTLSLLSASAWAQSPIPTCEPGEDPYQCGCPLELQDKVARCTTIRVGDIPRYNDPNVDTSQWMVTAWDDTKEQWKVSVNLDSAPAGRFFSRLSLDFRTDAERRAWLSTFYQVPLDDDGFLQPYYVEQRGETTFFDVQTSAIEPVPQTVGEALAEVGGCAIGNGKDAEAEWLGEFAVAWAFSSVCPDANPAQYDTSGNSAAVELRSTGTSRAFIMGRLIDLDLIDMANAAGGGPLPIRTVPTEGEITEDSPLVGDISDVCVESGSLACIIESLAQLNGDEIRFIRFYVASVSSQIRTQGFLEEIDENQNVTLSNHALEEQAMRMPSEDSVVSYQVMDRHLSDWDLTPSAPRVHSFDLMCARTSLLVSKRGNVYGLELKTAAGQYDTDTVGHYLQDLTSKLVYTPRINGSEYQIDFSKSAPALIDACHQWGAID